jgi:hypothetical protein
VGYVLNACTVENVVVDSTKTRVAAAATTRTALVEMLALDRKWITVLDVEGGILSDISD